MELFVELVTKFGYTETAHKSELNRRSGYSKNVITFENTDGDKITVTAKKRMRAYAQLDGKTFKSANDLKLALSERAF